MCGFIFCGAMWKCRDIVAMYEKNRLPYCCLPSPPFTTWYLAAEGKWEDVPFVTERVWIGRVPAPQPRAREHATLPNTFWDMGYWNLMNEYDLEVWEWNQKSSVLFASLICGLSPRGALKRLFLEAFICQSRTPPPSQSDILFLKHDSSTLRQPSNPVCGFSMMNRLGPVLFGPQRTGLSLPWTTYRVEWLSEGAAVML